MKILLVEDDEFKATDIVRALDELGLSSTTTRAASVTSALKAITECSFDLAILDMSLPTFDLSGPGGGGSPQGQGGIEVIRLARRLGHKVEFIIITQYPDIELDGAELPLAQAASKLSDRFKSKVLGCVHYEFDSNDWRANFFNHVRKAQHFNVLKD